MIIIIIVLISSQPSSSDKPIWVSGYTCSGSESRLSTCTNTYPIGYTPSCTHSRDAGLSCSKSCYNVLSTLSTMLDYICKMILLSQDITNKTCTSKNM